MNALAVAAVALVVAAFIARGLNAPRAEAAPSVLAGGLGLAMLLGVACGGHAPSLHALEVVGFYAGVAALIFVAGFVAIAPMRPKRDREQGL